MRGVRCPILVGREQELDLLTGLLMDRGAGAAGMVFVSGESGIGKSRLLAAAADVARSRNIAVLRGRAASTAAPVPYRPLAEAFLSVLRGRDVDGATLGGYRAALPVLLPGSAGSAGVDARPSVMVVGEAVLTLAGWCAGPGGSLLVLDDLQWADAETCEVLDYLSDKLDATGVSVLGSIRTGDRSPGERLARDLATRRHAELIRLDRLHGGALDTMIAASLGADQLPAGVSTTVAEASGGVPFLVEELLTTLADTGALWRDGTAWRAVERLPAVVPPSFAAVVAERLHGLSPQAARALTAAAVLGDRVEPGLVAAASEEDEASIRASLGEAVRAQLLDEDRGSPRALRFRHGLSRAAVLASMTEDHQRDIAGRALRAIDLSAGGRLRLDAAELVDLVLHAGDTARATRLLIEAATAALANGACGSAREAAQRAAEFAATPDARATAQVVLLDATVAAGDTLAAAQLGRSLLTLLADLPPDPCRRARVSLRLAQAAAAATDWSAADRHVDDAAAVGLDLPEELRARTELVRATIALGRHRPDDALASADRAQASATAADKPAIMAEAAALSGRAHRVTDLGRARAAFEEAVGAAQRSGDRLLIATTAHELATLDVLEAGSTAAMEHARRLAQEAGALALVAGCDLHLAILHWLHFDLDACRASAQRALDAAVRHQLGLLVPLAGVMVPGPDALLGRPGPVVEAFDRYLPLMDAEIEATQRGHVLALLALALEDRTTAMAELEHARRLAPPHSDVSRAPHSGLRALLLAVEGSDQAAGVTAELRGGPASAGVTRALVELALAVLDGGATPQSAGDRAERALAALTATPWWEAMALRLVGEAAARGGWGRPDRWLRRAHDFFAASGIHAPAAACRQALRRAGVAPPRPPGREGHPELARLGVTRREAEVLALVARGLSNREVADRLVLSVRTVEKHVENLMAKAGVRNRTKLAALSAGLYDPAGAEDAQDT